MRAALTSVVFLVLILYSRDTHGDENGNSEEENLKTKIVSDIINKVTNLTTSTFAKAPPKEKAKILTKIRNKLMKASSLTGTNSKKYVDLVMEGVEAIANGVPEAEVSRRTATGNMPQVFKKPHEKLEEAKSDKHAMKKNKSIKDKLVRSIANKIQSLTKVAFYKIKTREEKEKIMENIKNRVIEAAKKNKIMIHSQDNDIKPYGELVVEGVKLVLQKEFQNGTERRTSVEANDDTPAAPSKEVKETSVNEINEGEVGEINNSLNLPDTNKLDLCGCSCIIEDTCGKISALNTFTCKDKTEIPLEKMCDGKPNCGDQSDEEECAKNAIKKLQNATALLAHIETLLPRKCLRTNLEDDVLSSQNDLLDEVLKRQLEFIKKNNPTKDPQFLNYDNNQIKLVVNDVARIVGTVAIALEAAFCVHEGDPNMFSRRAMTVIEDDLDELFEKRSWAPPICTCKEEFCAKSNCTPVCQRTCWQRYSLNRWTCAAITAKDTVDLDVICDGKVDCYDESDEIGCSTGKAADKFDAKNMFNFVLKLLHSKIALKEYHPVLNQLNALQKSVFNLQELSTRDTSDVLAVKQLRDTCFKDLIAIYDKIMDGADVVAQVDEAYLVLSTVSENLVGGLKHSQTGNKKIVMVRQCLCREDQCTATSCSPTCRRACSVKPKLTKYTCNRNPTVLIPTENICNGKSDCPNGEDEDNCKDEICRNHHIMLIRNEIQNIRFNKGYTVTEILNGWKTKAIATLTVMEKRGRSTRKVLQKVVSELLHDLMMAYASIGEVRRTVSPEQNIDDFVEVARNIQESLRSCSK